jgi:hypothetical protein
MQRKSLQMPSSIKSRIVAALMLSALLTGACSTTRSTDAPPPHDPPPILAQDEIIRPYVELGRIRVTREVYGILDYNVNPDIREWGMGAIRAEADKMGADAIILAEVTGVTTTYLVLPSTEFRATGIAIKFK